MSQSGPSSDDRREPDAFELLGLEPRTVLGTDEIEQAFRAKAARQHPDAGLESVDGDGFAALGTARDILLSPARRLEELHRRLTGPSADPVAGQRRTVTLNDELNRLFPVVGSAMGEGREAIARRDRTKSDLARALVTPALLKARQGLIAAQDQVRAGLKELEAQLPDLDDDLKSRDLKTRDRAADKINQLQGQFACLERWQVQLRQQTAACMF